MEHKYSFTPDEVDAAFAMLATALTAHGPLPCKNGRKRSVPSGEFMLMSDMGDLNGFAFKHRVTRNYLYVFLATRTGVAYIPKGGPFCGGVFDGYWET